MSSKYDPCLSPYLKLSGLCDEIKPGRLIYIPLTRFTKHSVNHKIVKCFSGWYEVRIVQLTDLNLNVEVDY